MLPVPFDVVVSVNIRDKFQQLPINGGWCLSSVHRQSGGYCQYATETGTHSAELTLDWLLTYPSLCMSRSWRRGRFPWSSPADHCDSPVALSRDVRCPCCAGPALSSKAVCEKTVEIPQMQLVEFWIKLLHARRCATTDAGWFRVQKTAKVPQLQYI